MHNIITIEKNIPIPFSNRGNGSRLKYLFVQNMEVGDSFYINGNTPDFIPATIKAHIYKLNSETQKTYTIRTLEGCSKNPIAIRVWRTK